MEDRVILTPKERLQRLSEHLDMSVRGLATLAEMSEATLYHITDGTRDMSGRTAARLCYQLEKKPRNRHRIARNVHGRIRS